MTRQPQVLRRLAGSTRPRRAPWRLGSLLALGFVLLVTACERGGALSPLQLGQRAQEQGDTAAAMVHYRVALQENPALVEARVALGMALLATGDAEAAVIELQRALSEGADQALVQPLYARALLRTGDYKRAVHVLGSISTGNARSDASVQAELALAWNGLGDAAKSRAALARALEVDPTFPYARLLNARMQAGRGEIDVASQEVAALLKENPRDVDALLLEAELLSARRQAGPAIDALKRLLEVEPASVPAHGMLVDLYLQRGDNELARTQYGRMSEVAPVHPLTRMAEVRFAVIDGDLGGARERLQKMLAVLPDNATVLAAAGVVEARLGSLTQASNLMRKALTNEPRLVGLRLDLAEVQVRLGEYADAASTLTPLLQSSQVSPAALAMASEVRIRQGDFKAADELMRRAIAAAPEDARLQTLRLVRRFEQGDAGSSLRELEGLSGRTTETIADEALFAARLARGEFDQALEVLSRLEQKQPGKAAHQEMRGRVSLARRDLAGAREAFERALAMDPSLFGAVVSLVAIDQLENRIDQSIARVQAIVDQDPRHSVALLALAELKARFGSDTDEVRQLLRRAADASPLSPEPKLRLIELSLRKRQTKQALSYAQEALVAFPGDPKVLEAVGGAQVLAGDVEQAVSTFRRLAGAVPNAALPYVRLAQVYSLQNQTDAALTAARKAVELDPRNSVAQQALVDLLVAARRPQEAADYVRRQRELRPNDPGSYTLEAAYHMRQRAVDSALASLREGVSRTRSSDLAELLYSHLLHARKDAEAVRFAGEWMRSHPNDVAFEYLIAVRELARGEYKVAEPRLRRVVEVYPTNALALNNLAWVTVQLGGSGAVEWARRAVSLAPDRPDLMDTLAMALSHEGRHSDALAMQRRALDLSPDNPTLQLGLARVALQAGDKRLAREQLDRLRKLGAEFPGQAEVDRLYARI